MARKPRPVDPTEGPLQAFAFDLRALRESVGNPTYRALATRAGFGATTLSDAAGGVRKPSLEVTLAFVGACGGDVELWERRWRELDRSLAGEAPSPPEDGPEPALPAAEPEATVPTAEDTPETGSTASRPGRRRRLWWVAGVAAVVLAVLGALLAAQPGRPTPVAAKPDCGAAGRGHGLFTGLTYAATTKIRDTPGLSATVLGELPPGCTLQFTGYCLGDVVFDLSGQSPDMRWFELAGGGLVASAVVHGNPPRGLQPTPCRGSVPPPSSVSLTVVPPAAGSDTAEFRAAGAQLAIVGFAAYFAQLGAGDGKPKWHQIAIMQAKADGFAAPWRVGPLRDGLTAQGSVPVAAVACLGGEGPTGVADIAVLSPATLTPVQSAPLTADDRTAAESAACSYPRAG